MTDQTVMNGRTDQGRFAPGNQAAAGRSSRAAELRKAFAEAVSAADIAAIACGLVTAAKGGCVQSAKLILDRCCGRPSPDADENAERQENTNRILTMLSKTDQRRKTQR
jgi:hypothetical protein